MAVGIIASLFSWDLHFFQARVNKAHSEDSPSHFVVKHLWQLAVLGTSSLGLSLIIFHFHYKFSFEWTLVFIFTVMVGILFIANIVRKQT